MSQLPLEDQLRSMILKNNAPPDGAIPSPNDGNPPASQTLPQHSRQPSSPHPRGGRHPNRGQSQQLSQQNTPAGSPKPHHPPRHGPHHGRGQSGPGRPYFGQASPQQRQQSFSPQQPSPGYVPPHMRNRSSELHQQRGGYHHPRGSWQHHQMGQSGSPVTPQSSSPGNVGPPQNFRQMAPPGLQILQRPHPSGPGHSSGPGHTSGPVNGPFRPGPPLYNTNQRYQQHQLQLQEHLQTQCRYLGALAAVEIPEVAMTDEELKEKEEFVQRLQDICQNEISSLPEVPSVEFKCFGSIGTGFATKGSDIDLAVVTADESDTELAQKVGPRVLEKIFLDHGFGARLLTNTRVPIIKFCEKPSDELRENLKAERKKWDDLPEEEKKALLEGGPKSPGGEGNTNDAEAPGDKDAVGGDDPPSSKEDDGPDADKKAPSKRKKNKGSASTSSAKDGSVDSVQKAQPMADGETATSQLPVTAQGQGAGEEKNPDVLQKREPRPEKPWLREKPMGPLDFPKEGVGIQCDLNFAGHLGIYNTQLLHCYAISDQRIRDMVIFVKAWAKTRKINSSYNGTLSSYGYALLVLHYLIRIPEEPLTPDLQLLSNLPTNGQSPKVVDVTCHGHAVKFLADEAYIREKAHSGQWSRNQDTLGALLRGFFRYYGCPGIPDRVGGFHWTRDVITFGQRKPWDRMVTKEELGWTKARVEKDSKKEVRHRYLVCIQDPFELDHNVGRTVNHQGICAIREEFRRAWRILDDEAHGRPHKDLFASVDADPPPPQYVGGQQPRPGNANAQTEQANSGASARNGQGSGGAAAAATAAVVMAADAEAGLETRPLAGPLPTTTRKGIVSTVDGARRPSAGGGGGGTGFGVEAIAKVNGKLAEAARRGSLK